MYRYLPPDHAGAPLGLKCFLLQDLGIQTHLHVSSRAQSLLRLVRGLWQLWIFRKAVHFVLTKMHAREAVTQHHVRVQVVLVSATLPHEVLEMTHKFMTEPLRVLVKRDELTLEARPAALKEISGLIGLKSWGMTHKFMSNSEPLRTFAA